MLIEIDRKSAIRVPGKDYRLHTSCDIPNLWLVSIKNEQFCMNIEHKELTHPKTMQNNNHVSRWIIDI